MTCAEHEHKLFGIGKKTIEIAKKQIKLGLINLVSFYRPDASGSVDGNEGKFIDLKHVKDIWFHKLHVEYLQSKHCQ